MLKNRIAMVLTLAVLLATLMVGSTGTALAQQVIGGAIQC
jgi:hypothetical protein